MQRLSVSFYRSHPQGDLIYRISSDTNGFITAFNVVFGLLVNAITLLFMFAIMLSMNWKMALVAVSITPLLFWAIRKYGGVLNKTTARAQQIEAGLATAVHRSVATMGLVQAFGREDDEYKRFSKDVDASSNAWIGVHMQGMVYWAVLGICFGLGASLVIGYGGHLAQAGMLAVGDIWIFFIYVTTQLYAPLQAPERERNRTSPRTGGDEPGLRDSGCRTGDQKCAECDRSAKVAALLRLDRVGFAYRADVPSVLRDVDVSIEPGEMVAFVGSSGAGKTSLLNLLPGFTIQRRGPCGWTNMTYVR